MKVGELRKKDKKELEKMLRDRQRSLNELRFQLAMNKIKNVSEIKKTKREIARILTILKEKENA